MPNSNDWGLTKQGFKRPSYTEILDGFEYKAKEVFTVDGKTPKLTVRSFLGMSIRISAWITNLLFQLLEDVYNSQFVDTAAGASLYQLARKMRVFVLSAQRSSGHIEITTEEPGVKIPEGYLISTIAGIQFAVMSSGTTDEDGKVTLPIRCLEFGSIGNVGADTITQVVTPIGSEKVTNPKETAGGREPETDEELRDRYYESLDMIGGVNADAIQARLLQENGSIRTARVFENDKDYEVNGMPPHSIEAVVFGGLDAEIAQTIYDAKGAGAPQTVGNQYYPVISKQNGQTYNIYFSRPESVKIWVQVTELSITQGEFPEDGIQQIKDNLVGFIGADNAAGLGISEPVIRNQLHAYIYRVPGVQDFKVRISKDGENYGRDNILVGDRQKAVTSDSLITITLADEELRVTE